MTRTKIAESWLYHPAAVDRGTLIAAAIAQANAILAEWLLVPMPLMAGMMSAHLDPPCSLHAARALLHALVNDGQVAALGMLTAAGEPYLGLFRHDDRDEVERQLSFVRDTLACGSLVTADDLPTTDRTAARTSWSKSVLLHAEFRCWGRLRAGVLEPWTGR